MRVQSVVLSPNCIRYFKKTVWFAFKFLSLSSLEDCGCRTDVKTWELCDSDWVASWVTWKSRDIIMWQGLWAEPRENYRFDHESSLNRDEMHRQLDQTSLFQEKTRLEMVIGMPNEWGDFSQLQIRIKPKSQFGYIPRDTKEFKSNQNLNSNLWHEIPRNLNFSIVTSWLKSPHHSGFRFAFRWPFRVFSGTGCTAYCMWSDISSISNLNRCSISLGLFCHVPLKRNQGD